MHEFITEIKKRLNQGIALHSLCIAVISVSLLVIFLSLTYLFRGYSTALWIFPFGAILTVIIAMTLWLLKKRSD